MAVEVLLTLKRSDTSSTPTPTPVALASVQPRDTTDLPAAGCIRAISAIPLYLKRRALPSIKDATKTLAFSPDIVPHGSRPLDAATLIGEYNQFIGLPLEQGSANVVQIRATTASSITPVARATVSLRSIDSHLILWPQRWSSRTPISPTSVTINSLTPNKVVAFGDPFVFIPNSMANGYHHALIAVQGTGSFPPTPPNDVKNWREFIDFINNDTSTTFYNVVPVIENPMGHVVPISTRLAVIDDGTSDLNFYISLVHSNMPQGTIIKLWTPSGKISMNDTTLPEDGSDIGLHTSLQPGFDEEISLSIYPPSGARIQPFAWLSLRASIVVTQPTQSANIPISNTYLLGAQNVVFNIDYPFAN
ncbi:hypothetical protein CVT25_009634 [Psilocybe cyanescens]|uniref:Uncharacterized protein n=1 Tax=Psilocybe cyanescens TaxID=93625 RepID=A0A409XGW8_PSICY|nr:hypothetical protein CVT25_009634 [Psilocybe cyanescens]